MRSDHRGQQHSFAALSCSKGASFWLMVVCNCVCHSSQYYYPHCQGNCGKSLPWCSRGAVMALQVKNATLIRHWSATECCLKPALLQPWSGSHLCYWIPLPWGVICRLGPIQSVLRKWIDSLYGPQATTEYVPVDLLWTPGWHCFIAFFHFWGFNPK